MVAGIGVEKTYPHPQIRPYIPRIPAGSSVAVMTRAEEPGRGRAADNAARRSRRAERARSRSQWSAGRRSVSVAGFATPPHEARAPRDGTRNPVPVGASGAPIARAPQGRRSANPWRHRKSGLPDLRIQ
jgi:hypothetical protein